MHKFYYLLLFFCVCLKVNSQDNRGQWDDRLYKRFDIYLSSGESKSEIIKLPTGTKKMWYRINVVSETGDIAKTLADLLKDNPDPRVKLAAKTTSLIANNSKPKCSYSISRYNSNNKSLNLCYSSNGVITGDVINYFDSESGNCIDIKDFSNILSFKFKSENKLFKLKVILEYVPYIDYELSRGWTYQIKQTFFNNFKNDFKQKFDTSSIPDREIDNFLGCLLIKVINEYTFEEFSNLTNFEMNEMLKRNITECMPN